MLSNEYLAELDRTRKAIAAEIERAELETDRLIAEANWPIAAAKIEEAKFKGRHVMDFAIRGHRRCTGYVNEKTHRVVRLFAKVAERHGYLVNNISERDGVVAIVWERPG